MADASYYVYLVECVDGSLYCGYTNNLKKRIELHNNGQGAKFTRSRRPVHLVYHEVYHTKSEALQREAQIKKLSRLQKQNLIQTQRS